MKRRVWALIRKEFTEYRRNKLIVVTMTLLPAAFLFVAARAAFALPAHASPAVLRAVFGQARLFLLIVPLFLPSTIAAYSVIGEREQGALEPVLTTPATDGRSPPSGCRGSCMRATWRSRWRLASPSRSTRWRAARS